MSTPLSPPLHFPCRKGKSKFIPKDIKMLIKSQYPSRPPPTSPSRKKIFLKMFQTSSNTDVVIFSGMTVVEPILVNKDWDVKNYV